MERPLELSVGVIHVVRVRLDYSPQRIAELSEFLSDDERKRAARFRFDDPRRQFVTCRSALRRLLGHCCGTPPADVLFQYGPHGKPELARGKLDPTVPQIEFSVSHSGEMGLIAITVDARVGIDIEQWHASVKALRLAERFFSEVESDELRNLPAEKLRAGFYRGWTCKEAYIKATGKGLSLPLDSFCVTMDPDLPVALCSVDNEPDASQRWTISSLDVAQGYAAAVMADQPDCRFDCWDWPY